MPSTVNAGGGEKDKRLEGKKSGKQAEWPVKRGAKQKNETAKDRKSHTSIRRNVCNITGTDRQRR